MIDIHSHVLPMVDDGANSVEMALEMLANGYDDGSDAIVLTPHLAYAYGFINPQDKIKELFNDLKYIVERQGIPIKLYLGCEFLFSSVATFRKHFDEITTLNGTRYLLMEFFFDISGQEILEAVDEVIKAGLIPVIAHPERYECVQISLEVVRKAVKKGALLQMNKGSVLGGYGRHAKEAALEMLDEHLISFVGSDSHGIRYRTTTMGEAYLMVKDIYGRSYAKDIFTNNAKQMLLDIDIREGQDEKVG